MEVIIMNQKLLKPIAEVTYLTTDNAWRYRSILRYFYLQHERLHHYLFPEEIYQHLKQTPFFQEYTEEQLQGDLNQLVQWKNIIPRQETGNVTSIADFKKKKFRYQATPYTIEIERMVQGLENLGDSFAGSLETTLFDRLLETLNQLTAKQPSPVTENGAYQIATLSNEKLNRLWEDLYDHFRKLTENATDYLAHLKSEKVEEIMMTEAFLTYKESLTEYLRNFMTKLQRSSFKIEAILKETPMELIQTVASRLTEYQLNIPRLTGQPEAEELEKKYLDQWFSIKNWFLGNENQRESELFFLQNETNETIRRITRYAQRLGERHHNFRSRKKDYHHIAKWFYDITDIKEAHKLSAAVFGVFHTKHLFAESAGTEDIYAEIFDQHPTIITINPRIRQYREKTKPNAVIDRKEEKQMMLEKYLKEKEAEQQMIQQLINKDKIILSDLPQVDPYVRKTILNWIGKALNNRDQTAKTETGRHFKLIKLNDNPITLHANDGTMTMPNYVLYFLD